MVYTRSQAKKLLAELKEEYATRLIGNASMKPPTP